MIIRNTTSSASHESRVRRLARRQGLMLRKSRRRDSQCADFGVYWIVDPFANR